MPENRSSAHRLDPRQPLVIDTRELSRRPGSMRKLALRVPAPASLGLDMIAVPDGAELDLQLRLEAVMEGVLVTGRAHVPLTGECGRCLDPIDSSLDVDLQELFAYPESAATDDEAEHLVGDLLDLEPTLRDAVVLALPLTPLCREDCPGLCASCGARLADGDCGHSAAPTDIRWAALEQLGSAVPDDPNDPD